MGMLYIILSPSPPPLSPSPLPASPHSSTLPGAGAPTPYGHPSRPSLIFPPLPSPFHGTGFPTLAALVSPGQGLPHPLQVRL